MKTRSPPASLPFKAQVTKQSTVKWSIVPEKPCRGRNNKKEWMSVALKIALTRTSVHRLDLRF